MGRAFVRVPFGVARETRGDPFGSFLERPFEQERVQKDEAQAKH